MSSSANQGFNRTVGALHFTRNLPNLTPHSHPQADHPLPLSLPQSRIPSRPHPHLRNPIYPMNSSRVDQRLINVMREQTTALIAVKKLTIAQLTWLTTPYLA